jgi:hypothetical protein
MKKHSRDSGVGKQVVTSESYLTEFVAYLRWKIKAGDLPTPVYRRSFADLLGDFVIKKAAISAASCKNHLVYG